MFLFFKSYYVGDAAFVLLSRGEVIAASTLIISHIRRFGLTMQAGGKRKLENGGHSLSKAWTGIIGTNTIGVHITVYKPSSLPERLDVSSSFSS
jgi:hypothetical protein